MEASWATYLIALITPHMTYDLLQDLFQMGASSYPGMTQPFSMAHSTNMGSVGVRQDSMGEFHGTICLLSISSIHSFTPILIPIRSDPDPMVHPEWAVD